MSFSPCASVPQRLGGMSAPFCDDHCIFLRHDVVHDVFELRESAQAIFRSASFIARIVSHICMLVRECGVHRTTYCSRIDERMPLCTEDLTWLLPVTISLENLRVRTRMRRPRFSKHAAHALFEHFSPVSSAGALLSPSDSPFDSRDCTTQNEPVGSAGEIQKSGMLAHSVNNNGDLPVRTRIHD